MSRVTAAAAAAVDVEDGVLSLLEDQTNHEIAVTTVSLMTESSIRSTATDVNSSTIVVQHDPESNQARAVAALQQADSRAHQSATETEPRVPAQLEQPIGGQDIPSTLRLEVLSPNRMDIRESQQPENASLTMVDSSDVSLPFAPPQSICLCQAPARIPRPRNAFILFRQHHHAAVVAQHPGKPNPEISKIIGQMWKSSSDEIKSVWQSHADEEKRQHIQRYPQYRYQPRRNAKKNTSVTLPNTSDSMPSSIETAICPNCGGRTGALSVSQTPSTPMTRRAKANAQARQVSMSVSNRKKAESPDETTSRISAGSGNGTGVDQAGVEALLQLGLDINDDIESRNLPKRRKLMSTNIPQTSILSQNLYTAQFSNIDPYLRHGSFDHESSMHPVDPEGGFVSGNSQITNFGTQTPTDVFSIRAMPILKKIYAIKKICPPLSSPTIPPFHTPAITRMPVIIVEGDDVDVVASLYRSIFQEIEKSEPVYGIDEPDDLTILSEAYLEGLLSSTGLDRDKDTDDTDAARYLNHVASWRRRSMEIRRIITAESEPRLVLINRYILSRSDAAALRLSTDGLSPLEHWQWCATVWRSCIGADMTIYVQTLSENTNLGDDAIESKDEGKVLFVRKASGSTDWDSKVIRRLSFEVGEIVRNLKGFGG
ncbi:hypothetical protein EDC01DRAFT_612700 [Geopyxis carbonaria]|nr:hypothetical protein EDC01DRAFT_612700 [Geopyxis carbonaria]